MIICTLDYVNSSWNVVFKLLVFVNHFFAIRGAIKWRLVEEGDFIRLRISFGWLVAGNQSGVLPWLVKIFKLFDRIIGTFLPTFLQLKKSNAIVLQIKSRWWSRSACRNCFLAIELHSEIISVIDNRCVAHAWKLNFVCSNRFRL